MTATLTKAKENKELYKRLLRRSATPNALDALIEPVTARLKTRMNEAFKEAGYDFITRFEGHAMSFNFKNSEKPLCFTGIGPKTKAPVCGLAVGLADAKMIVDLMLGADPDVEMDVDDTPMVPIQEAVYQEFGIMLADVMRIVFKGESLFDAVQTDGRRLNGSLEDLVELKAVLAIAKIEISVSIMISQKQLLKLEVRKSDDVPETDEEEDKKRLPPHLSPDRNVDMKIDAVVGLPNMTLEDVANLRIGHKIAINGSAASETLLLANGHKLHRGRIGQDNNHYALLVEDAYEPMQSIVNATQQ